MSKRIIFCADGTWDTPENDTNVYILFKALTVSPGQIVFYDDGVGSDGTPLEKLLGGALGNGLFQKIKDGYTKVAHVYEQGDEIFIFGFSRGAFTARSLAGMIAICGVPTQSFDEKLVETAFQAYRNKGQRAALLGSLAGYNLFNAQITMVGVWDTVGSLGIPALFGGIDPLIYGFLDTSLHPNVLNAYHALAIDEKRAEFPPTLWTPPSTPVDGQTIEQVWFCGAHCDVGGGYPETGLSGITLSWMMGKAKALGVDIDAGVWSQYSTRAAKYALDHLHQSWNPLWLFPKLRSVPNDSTLGNSVSIRCQYDSSYQPSNLSVSRGVLTNSYQTRQVVLPPADP